MDTGQIWIGRTIGGRYQLESQIGRGGMAIVYRATDTNLRRDVAIKIIHPHLTDNKDFVERFEQEAAAIAQLRHGHIIKVFDFSQDNGVYYMVMEYIPGDTLAQRLTALTENGAALPLVDIVDLMRPICEAVEYAHQQRLIHRDIKPANILIDQLGRPTLMDFGIAKLITGSSHAITGAAAGTAAYMAPELFQKGSYDHRVDIYSLGIVLYEMLSGAPPFTGDSTYAVVNSHLNQPLPDLTQLDPGLPSELIAIVRRALAKGPLDRYQTAQEMIDDLETFRREQLGPHDKPTTQRLSRLRTLLKTAETAAAENRPADALALLIEVEGLDPDYETETIAALRQQLITALVATAHQAVEQEQYGRAEAQLAALQAFAPNHEAIATLISQIEMGRQHAARANRLDKLYDRALAHLSQNDYEAALQTYQALQKEAGDIDYVDRMQVARRAREGISQQRYRAAHTALAAGHPEEALRLWQQLQDENPDFEDEDNLVTEAQQLLTRQKRRRPLLIGAVAMIGVLLIILIAILFANNDQTPVAALATATPTRQATAVFTEDSAAPANTTSQPTPTATASAPAATATPRPSPTATATPLPTAAAIAFPDRLATIAEPSSIYSAPNGASRELAVVGIDETVTVIGRSRSSTWLFVRNRDGVAGFIYGQRVLWDGDVTALPTRESTSTGSSTAVPTLAASIGPLEFDMWPLTGTVRCNSDGSWTQRLYFNGRGGSGRYIYYWDNQRLAGPTSSSHTYTIRSGGAAVTGEGRITSGDGQSLTRDLFVPIPDCGG